MIPYLTGYRRYFRVRCFAWEIFAGFALDVVSDQTGWLLGKWLTFPVVAILSFVGYFLGRRRASLHCFLRRRTSRVHCFVGAPNLRVRKLDRIVVWSHPSLFGGIALSCSDCLFRGTPGVTCVDCLMFVVCLVHFDSRNVRTGSPGIRFVDIRLFVMLACGRRSCCVGTCVAVVVS